MLAPQPPETSRRPPPRDCLRHSRDLGSILAPRACSVCEAPSAGDETFPRSRTRDPPTPLPSHPRLGHPASERVTPTTSPELGVGRDVPCAHRAALVYRVGVLLRAQSHESASLRAGASPVGPCAVRLESPIHRGHASRRARHLPSALLAGAAVPALALGGPRGVLSHTRHDLVRGPSSLDFSLAGL